MTLLSRRTTPRSPLAVTLLAAGSLVTACCGTTSGQVVQLPSVQTFGASGTVSVPDGGGVLLGGNGYSRTGSTTRGAGPLSSRAIGQQSGASSMSVHATIIDLDAMDEAILSRANSTTNSSIQSNYRPNSYGTAIANTLNPTRYSQQVVPRSARAANDWQLAMAGATHILQEDPNPALARDNSAVRFYMQRAADAQSAGRFAAARVYFRMAFDLLSPEQQSSFNALIEQRKLDAKPVDQLAASDSKAAAPVTPQTPPPPASTEPTAESAASPFDMPASSSDPNASPF